ncbi:DUF4143 domain-containing protein [Sphingobium sp. RAC03]|uniref:DUF4143 domain-containing protein n=1 Tax=Sphingobium sp. RAC03 TaxID=1843368 RepID=UPI001495CF94|nr:DUF4143 domain-containing protein [Sphingobium sp. RAC03]
MLHGLPRVGRTRIVNDWADRRGDVAIISADGQAPDAPILLFDHVREADVAGFLMRFREYEAASRPTRFVVVPSSLFATRQLSAELAGAVRQIDVEPMQLEDYLNEAASVSDAQGPVCTALPQPVATDAAPPNHNIHWLRGGLPPSINADSDEASLTWRRDMLGGLFDRNYSSWSLPTGVSLLHVLQWAANKPGSELIDTDCPNVKKTDLLTALYILDRLGVTRRLSNYPAGTNAGMAKKEKLYIRDSGLLHAMMGIATVEQLRTHVEIGESWESYGLEALILAAGGLATAQYYRMMGDNGQEEIDLVLDFKPRLARVIACEFKTSPNKEPRPGFFSACAKIEATDRFVVHSGPAADLDHSVHRLDLTTAVRRIAETALEAGA